MAFAPAVSKAFKSAISDGAGVAAIPWYLSGGIAAANCIAAYQPLRSASYVASNQNIKNPGTFDLALDLGTDPLWDASYGWRNNKTGRFATGITANQTWSVFIYISISPGGTEDYVIGNTYQGPISIGTRHSSGTKKVFGNGDYILFSNAAVGTMTLGVSGKTCFLSGNPIATIGAGTVSGLIYILAITHGLGFGFVGDFYAASIYDTTITDAQNLALHNAALLL